MIRAFRKEPSRRHLIYIGEWVLFSRRTLLINHECVVVAFSAKRHSEVIKQKEREKSAEILLVRMSAVGSDVKTFNISTISKCTKCKVGISKLLYGLCICKGDNPLAKARG